MDNFAFDVTSRGHNHLSLIMQLAFAGAAGGKATHYRVTVYEGVPTLILYWNPDVEAIKFLSPCDVDTAVANIESWLAEQTCEQPDHDGSNSRGWRVFNGAWGHVAGSHYAFVGVQFCWAMHGK